MYVDVDYCEILHFCTMEVSSGFCKSVCSQELFVLSALKPFFPNFKDKERLIWESHYKNFA